MFRNIIFVFLTFIGSFSFPWAQSLDEEMGFIYVKAEYLLETGRYEEAVNHYNQVINKDPSYKDALVHRGMAKYALAAYKGAKNDAMQHIELLGISASSAALLGRSFDQLGQSEAAINSLTAAILMDDEQSEYYLWRAQVYEARDMRLNACRDYQSAVDMGNLIAAANARSYCGISTPVHANPPVNNSRDSYPTPPVLEQTDNGQVGENEVLSEGTQEAGAGEENPTEEYSVSDPTEMEGENTVDDNIPPDDNTVNTIVIDEELSIMISGQALGKRSIDEVPSILILADETGKVALDVCVDREGTVIKAEFNSRLSTIAKKSLVSLAMRKAREFEFSTITYDMQCGLMIFEIKG